jgi:hypothetical protein
MKRKFLEDMGLAKEQVDSIMAENGNDIEAVKQERDTYKTQLSTAQATLKSFEGVNISELQGKIQTLTTDLANKDAEYQKQLAERDFNDLLKVTAEGFNPRDIKAVMPFLDVEKLKGSKKQISRLPWKPLRRIRVICFRTSVFPGWLRLLLGLVVRKQMTQGHKQTMP